MWRCQKLALDCGGHPLLTSPRLLYRVIAVIPSVRGMSPSLLPGVSRPGKAQSSSAFGPDRRF